jgi:WD40 repeat protein
LVAVGTEKGAIRLLDTAWRVHFSETVLTFAPQTNAVIDMQFSADDSVLATACGDQMARLVDMRTQKTTALFKNHRSSIKQVLFHPSDESVIATCSRDGNVNLWDIRCSADTRMVTSLTYPDQGIWVEANKIQTSHPAKFYDQPLIKIHRAHQDLHVMPTTSNSKTG